MEKKNGEICLSSGEVECGMWDVERGEEGRKGLRLRMGIGSGD